MLKVGFRAPSGISSLEVSGPPHLNTTSGSSGLFLQERCWTTWLYEVATRYISELGQCCPECLRPSRCPVCGSNHVAALSNSAVGQCVCPGSQVGRGPPADLQRAARLHIINARSGGTHAGMKCSVLDLHVDECPPFVLASSPTHSNEEFEWWQSAMPSALDSASSKCM
jgi:hypothetical protein